jgi:TonB family protein
MSAMTLQASQLWAGSYEEDRRFRRILLRTLVICLAVGVITPYVRIPQPDFGSVEDLPPRRVRLLAEQLMPAPRSLSAAPVVTAPPAPALAPAPQAVPEQPPAIPVVTPRQKAASTGVLAMSDALAELRGTTPKTGTGSGQGASVGVERAAAARASTLTANVTRGSRGIEGGVTHESVLGAADLPDREESGPGISSHAASVPARGRATTHSSGTVRSQDEIQEVLDRNKGAMYTLYNRELREAATLQGKLVMSITIAPAGNVTRCVILSSELGAASLEQQLVALIKRIDFGNKPGVPAVTTKIPIEFFPR